MPDEVLADAMACYEEKENREVSVAAAKVEYEHYCQYTRVQEIMAFAENMHMKINSWHCNMRRSVERESDVGTYFSGQWIRSVWHCL